MAIPVSRNGCSLRHLYAVGKVLRFFLFFAVFHDSASDCTTVTLVDKMWEKNSEQIGLILKCHLIIEYFMTECLKASYPLMGDFETARLSFAQKFQLLPKFVFGFPWLREGVQELNTMRNKIAHNIHYEITDKDLKKIHACMDTLYSSIGWEPKRGDRVLTDFTNNVCMSLSAYTSDVRNHTPETGIAGFTEKYKEMLHKE